MVCVRCGSERLIEISIRLHSDQDVIFRSCYECEHKWWERETGTDPERVSLDTILDLARVTRTA